MSINVTVSGNPISIRRGKMIKAGKDDFDKRRLMRLEQVRQQSKDIAENIRNKVKNDKTNRLSEADKEGEVKLETWQAKKLLQLQNQYQEALDNIGLGHRQAQTIEEEDELVLEQSKLNDEQAKERGRKAASKQQVENNEKSLKKAVPAQRKKLARDAENTRASSVVSGKKGAKSPAKSKKGSTSDRSYDSDGENRVPRLLHLTSSADSTHRDNSGVATKSLSPMRPTKVSKDQQTSTALFEVPTCDKFAQTQPEETSDAAAYTPGAFPTDTRISDRIKRRTIPSAAPNECTDYWQEVAKGPEPVESTRSPCCKCPTICQPSCIPPEPVKPPKERSPSPQKPKLRPQPKVTLRSAKKTPEPKKTPANVNYYDHPNRFSKTYKPKANLVERIDETDLFTSPILSDDGLAEKMRQRDREAHERGVAAMEKAKIQKEYNELLRKLPLLQKQERIGDIGKDQQKYHMNYDRLDEMEKKRQNRLDNAYEDVMIRRQPITIPAKKDGKRIQTIHVAKKQAQPPRTLNQTADRTNELNSLLAKLISQKSDLMKDIEKTLSTETVEQLTKLLSNEELSHKSKRKRSREEVQHPTSPRNEEDSVQSKSTSMSSMGQQTSSTLEPSPRKKAKRNVLVLQNMSTQTTPVNDRREVVPKKTQTVEIQTMAEQSAAKSEDQQQVDMCEIVIKLVDSDKKPEVIVNPATLSKNIRVISETTKSSDLEMQPESVRSIKVAEKAKAPAAKKNQQHSWRHELTNASSTSTSYYEPPEFVSSSMKTDKSKEKLPKNVSRSLNTTSAVSAYGEDGKQIDKRLLKYINKLLDMSRGNIDDMALSTVSEVSTPSQSVVEMPTNNPMAQLKNVLKYFNLDANEVQKQLASMSESSSSRESSLGAEGTTSTTAGTDVVSMDSSEVQKLVDMQTNDETRNKLIEYADVAANCTKKISDLTAMIEKVRAEKKKMLELSPTGSSEENTKTSYKDLPDSKSKDVSPTSQDDIDKNILGIDYSYAEKLKELTPDEIAKRREEMMQPERDFVPLLDIPKLPKLGDPLSLNQKRPPPSKGLRLINNGDHPHELSTIPEGDSQVSAKLDVSVQKATQNESSSSSSTSVPDLISEVKHADTLTEAKSSSGEEMESMETMLQSIGMEWAIPTLRKTREALALSSSDSSSKKDNKSEISLKDFLSRISTSTASSNGMSEIQELSVFNETPTEEDRKISTPVQGIRFDNIIRYGQPNIMQDSDISSVREHSTVGASGGNVKDKSDESTEKSK